MIPLLLGLALDLDTSPWDACADGDAVVCLQLAQSLPVAEGEPSKRAASLTLRSCTLGHSPACEFIVSGLPERHQEEQSEALVGACMEGADTACRWLQQSIPADYSVKESRTYCEDQDCEPDLAVVMPGQWRLHTPLSGHHFAEYVGAWVASTERRSTTYQTKEQAVWIEGRTRGINIVSDWVTFEGSSEPRRWWNPSSGQVSPSPSWCPDQGLLCAPDTPRPSDLKWMVQAQAQVPKGTQSTRVGDSLWLSRREQKDYRSGEVVQTGDLRILRAGQSDQVLAITGGVRAVSDDLVLVEDRMQTYLLTPQGELLHTLPFRGQFALSPDGQTLLLDEVFIDLATGEHGPNSATRCSQLTWDEGGAYCMTDVGLLHHPHPAGQPVDFVPPGGWEAYGRVEIQIPEYLPGQQLNLSDGNQSVTLGAPGSTFTLWVGSHVESLKLDLVSKDMAPTPYAQTVAYSPPAPGETLTLQPQVRALDVDFPACEGPIRLKTEYWGRPSHDCTLRLPSMLVGAPFQLYGSAFTSNQSWSLSSTVPENGAVNAQLLPPADAVRPEPLTYQGKPHLYGSGRLTWTDSDGQQTKVGDDRSFQVAEGSGALVLRQGTQTTTQPAHGNGYLKVGSGTWKGAVVTRKGSAPVTVTPASPDTLRLPEVEPSTPNQVRVLDDQGYPVEGHGVYVALDGQEPTWGALPENALRFETDSAGRAQIPDPGWPMWAWGAGWMVQLDGETQARVQAGPNPPLQRSINARLAETPYGLQVVSGVCVEEHWLEKGDTLVQACGEPLAGRSERALEELILASPTLSCPVQVLRPDGSQAQGELSATESSPLTIPTQGFPEQPPYDTPEYTGWREAVLKLAPAERCGPPLSSQPMAKDLAIEVLTPGDPALLVKDSADLELDYVVWVPAGFPVLSSLDGEQWPEKWPDSISNTVVNGYRLPWSVLVAAQELGAGATFRVWFQSNNGFSIWLVADVEIKSVTPRPE